MDQKVEVKEEPAWLEGMDNNEFVSEKTHSEERTKSELAEPGHTQVNNMFEPCADVKDEIFIEEHAVGQLVPYFKEENVEHIPVMMRGPLDARDNFCKVLKTNEVMCHLPHDNVCNDHHLLLCGERSYHERQVPPSEEHSNTFSSKSYLTKRPMTSMLGSFKQQASSSYLSKCLLSESRERPHICHQCGNGFRRKCTLEQHKLTHITERPYCYEECEEFFWGSTLKQKIVIHTDNRLYCCKECGKKFYQANHLQRHMVTHTGEGRYCCSECSKQFFNKSSMEQHWATHTRERSFFCNDCSWSFQAKNDLKKHIRIHTGEKPYSCGDCGKKFSLKSNLTRHLHLHAGDRAVS